MTKWLALFLMIIDHAGAIFAETIPANIYSFLRLIGRLSFPLYLYYLVIGLERTSDKKKYFSRIFLSAVISHIIINLTFPDLSGKLNILFSFSLYISYSILKDYYSSILFVPLFLILSSATDYSYMGFLSFLIIKYISENDFKRKQVASFLCLLILFTSFYLLGITGFRQIFGSLAGLLMFNDDLEKRVFSKNLEKWVMYLIYPLQWIIFYIIY